MRFWPRRRRSPRVVRIRGEEFVIVQETTEAVMIRPPSFYSNPTPRMRQRVRIELQDRQSYELEHRVGP